MATHDEPLATLLALLDGDPGNRPLLVDAAAAALDARNADTAEALMARAAAIAPLAPREANMVALAAMQRGDHATAAERFAALMAEGADDPGLRFNLAWARAASGDEAGALEVLDEAAARALPQAAALRVELLHQQGEVEVAMAAGRAYLALYPEHRGLNAAVSVLAIDAEDEALAAETAARAGDHPAALTTLGTLALGDDHASDALALFDRVLARSDNQPRAWVGRGLAKLMTGGAGAAEDMDRGAAMFGDHLGSWIAAGWGHFVVGDVETARARFETALGIDDTFAETHGSLAVLALLGGDLDEAERASAVALRLDRQCYSAALARSLLAAGAGDKATAQRIFDLAVRTPVDGSGRTIAQALATMGMGRG